MNPLRSLFLSLSRVPPALMLLIVIVLATMTTMIVTNRTGELSYKLKRENSEYVIIAKNTIPAHTKIEKSMIWKMQINKNKIWQDSIKESINAVGKTTDKPIPAQAQIRQTDLEF